MRLGFRASRDRQNAYLRGRVSGMPKACSARPECLRQSLRNDEAIQTETSAIPQCWLGDFRVAA